MNDSALSALAWVMLAGFAAPAAAQAAAQAADARPDHPEQIEVNDGRHSYVLEYTLPDQP